MIFEDAYLQILHSRVIVSVDKHTITRENVAPYTSLKIFAAYAYALGSRRITRDRVFTKRGEMIQVVVERVYFFPVFVSARDFSDVCLNAAAVLEILSC